MLECVEVKCSCGNVLFTTDVTGVTGEFGCLVCGKTSKFIHSLNPVSDDLDVEAAIRSNRTSDS